MFTIQKGIPIRSRQNAASYAVLLVASLLLASAITWGGVAIGLAVIAVLLGGLCLTISFFRIDIGVLVLLAVSFFLQGVNRFSPIPLGVINEAYVLVLTSGLLLQHARNNNLKIPTDELSVIIFMWAGYNILQIFNPEGSLQAWFHGVRGMILLSPFFFVVRSTVTSTSFVATLINTWLFFALLAALYGLYQEFFGLLSFERQWVMADPFRFKLLFNWGRFRIFSFMPDAALFGILMAYSSLLSFIIGLETRGMVRKIIYFIAGFLMVWALIYSGTRTAFVVLPAAFAFYCLLTFKRGAIAAMIAGGALLSIILFTDIRGLGPLTNNNLERIRSAFTPAKDESYQTRMYNQSRIQPYIHAHPFGGGVGSSGIYGQQYNQDGELADFAPDSGFVRAAVELGWVGLFLYCTFYFLVLRRGILAYYNLCDKELKMYCAGLTSVAFCLTLANFPQQSMHQVPTLFIFYAVMGILSRLEKLEKQKIPTI